MIREYPETSYRTTDQDEYKEQMQARLIEYGIQEAHEFYDVVEAASEEKERMMESVD